MSDAATLPLFYTKVVGVNPAVHGALRLDRAAGYGFAAGATSIPLGLGEFGLVARHYPDRVRRRAGAGAGGDQ